MNNPLSQLSSVAVLDMLGLQGKPTNSQRVMTYAGLIVAGAVVGAAAAILLTPKSGPDVRRDLRDGARTLGGRFSKNGVAAIGEAGSQTTEPGYLRPDVVNHT